MKKPLFLHALPLNPLAFLGALSFPLTERRGDVPLRLGCRDAGESPELAITRPCALKSR